MALLECPTQVKKKVLIEAQKAKFVFVLVQGDDAVQFPPGEVSFEKKTVVFNHEDGPKAFKYKSIQIQVMPASRKVYIGETVPAWELPLKAAVLLSGFAILWRNEEITEYLRLSTPMVVNIFGTLMILAGFALLAFTWLRAWKLERAHQIQTVTASSAIARLDEQSSEETYFRRLIQVNLRNMEQYYLLVRTQTEKSYRITVCVAVAGFIILVAGIVSGYLNVQWVRVEYAGITVICGAVVEFISSIFFYMYNRTIRQLNTYHERLIDVQDTMLALKVAQIVQEKPLKDKTMAYLTRALTSRLINSGKPEGKTTHRWVGRCKEIGDDP